jgi:hypothetical protein
MENRSWGQCAVTALLVQDRLGGRLLRTTVGGASHYLNETPDGERIDLTLEQFGPGATYDFEPIERQRDYVLSFPDTARRYELLRERIVLALL